MSYLQLDNIAKSFGAFQAVRNFELTVEKGQFVSLLGPSGCGKTTTLQMIAGFLEPDQGCVVLEGKDITNLPAFQRNLGIVFQKYALFPHMSVRDNVGFGLEMRKIPKEERGSKIDEMLEIVDLLQFSDRYPAQLSGGQQQRVALARALVIKPNVLLLDEPLSNLDAKLREDMQAELRSIQNNLGTTTILVTHDQSEAIVLSDQVVVMKDGEIQQIDSPYNLYENPVNSFISEFVGSVNKFSGRVTKSANGETAVDVNGVEFIGKGELSVGSDALVMLRPEKINFFEDSKEKKGSRIKAKILEKVFTGSQWSYELDSPLGKLDILVRNRGEKQPELHENVELTWSKQNVKLLKK